MKILFVNNNLMGLVHFRLDVMQHLQSQGHEVVAVVPKSEKARPTFRVSEFYMFR